MFFHIHIGFLLWLFWLYLLGFPPLAEIFLEASFICEISLSVNLLSLSICLLTFASLFASIYYLLFTLFFLQILYVCFHYFYPKDDILHSSRILRPFWFDDFVVSEGPEFAFTQFWWHCCESLGRFVPDVYFSTPAWWTLKDWALIYLRDDWCSMNFDF